MGYVLDLTQSGILTALRAVLASALPNIEIIIGQQSRVAEPVGTDFVVLVPLLRSEIEYPIANYEDVSFIGYSFDTVLTITSVNFGMVRVQAQPKLFGVGVAPNTIITQQLSGTDGGIGTYRLSIPQTLPSGKLAAGIVAIKGPTRLAVQTDVHGPNSPDNCQMISTLMRSLYGADLFKEQGVDLVSLYASEPRETPFMNAEQQIEWQWSVDCVLQANQIMQAPQQFADEAKVTTPPPVELTQPF